MQSRANGFGGVDRRTALRYPLRLPVVFSWQDESGRNQGCEGYCRDLGSRGIYIHSEQLPPLGVAIEMDVFLPRMRQSARASEIHAIGRVVRADVATQALEACGFAAMNHTTNLRETLTQKLDDQLSGLREIGTERTSRSRRSKVREAGI
jgi:PilZ domain